jgi:catechol 2,3-dioxygenase-like lactoylglutathione lyase family enzyme
MIAADPDTLAGFYEETLGFVRANQTLSMPTRDSTELRLGSQFIRLVRADPVGRPYPPNVASWNPLFQHIAIVVANMRRAYEHLSQQRGWKPISTSGPQVLPAASGGVSAFKFRDPEGHPLELIAFPAGCVPPQWQTMPADIYLGIDHSAISVSSTAESFAFYHTLGLTRSGGSLNIGREQAALDDVLEPKVEVTALTLAQATPHLELLCYRGNFDRRAGTQAINDVTATRLVLTIETRSTLQAICAMHSNALLSGPTMCEDVYCALLRDPDGHLIFLQTEKL